MQKIPFTKMHGLGNDFVVLDRISHPEIEVNSSLATKLGDRHFGVGCDQILVVEKSEIADFRYRIYNQDGSEVEMCGNGTRCFLQYVREKGLTIEDEVEVETARGKIILRTNGENIMVDMGPPILDDEKIPVKKGLREVTLEERKFAFIPVSMGNPHAVIFVDEVVELAFTPKYGPLIEKSIDIFPNKVNVEFVKVLSQSHIEMRVWERGAGETLACGTGACAAVVAGILSGMLTSNIPIRASLPGGDLFITWNGRVDESVMMSGPALTVFEGVFL